MKSNHRVAIIYRYIPQFRRDFYEMLREALGRNGIELTMIYGRPGPADSLKGDAIDLPWGIQIHNRIFKVGNKELYWQPVLKLIEKEQPHQALWHAHTNKDHLSF